MNYAVFLMGENFPIDSDGSVSLQGFFITKRIEASNEEEAAELAIASAKADPEIAIALSKASDITPTIQVRVVHQLPDSNKMKDTQYLYFPMEEI